MFTITIHCETHDESDFGCSVGWFPTETGEYRFEFANCAKGQILQEYGGCEVKVVMFNDDHYKGDEYVEATKIAEFNSKEYI